MTSALPAPVCNAGADSVAPIPPGAVLLHAGMPKSGTTAIQRAATARRTELAEHGVSYPGTGHNHSQASTAVAGQRRARPGVEAGSDAHWLRLLGEIRGDGRRIFLSHEFFAEHPVQVCRRIVTELERDVHVVLTVRNQASLLGSAWQQSLKQGSVAGFDEWLRTVLGEREPGKTLAFDLRTDLHGITGKWAEIVGPRNVTLVVLDRTQPERLTDTFEALLDVPHRTLGGVDLGGELANRSLNASEAELLRQLNVSLHASGHMTQRDFRALYRGGGIDQLLAREPASEEPSIIAPPWAVDAMVERAKAQVALLAELDVTVVGELGLLAEPVRAADVVPPATVPVGAAGAIALGILDRALELTELREERHAVELTAARSARPSARPSPPSGSLRQQVRVSTRATNDIPLRVLAQSTVGRLALKLRTAVRRSDPKKG